MGSIASLGLLNIEIKETKQAKNPSRTSSDELLGNLSFFEQKLKNNFQISSETESESKFLTKDIIQSQKAKSSSYYGLKVVSEDMKVTRSYWLII